MNKICGIYKITSPSGKIYIGQSTDVYNRIYRYKNHSCEKQRLLYRSLLKHGWDKHKFEVIHECLQNELNELEKYYVDLFQTFNSKHGLNLKEGGGNNKLSDETKVRIGLASKGRKFSKESRLKMSLKRRGENNNMYGVRLSGKLNGMYGRNHDDCAIAKMSKLILNLETGIFYISTNQAAHVIGMKPATLKSKLSGDRPNNTSFIYA